MAFISSIPDEGVEGPTAGMYEADRASLGYVANDAATITRADIDRLRDLGLSEADVVDVVAAAAARCFFSKALDALGVEPDSAFAELEPDLRDALTVGRPIGHE